MDLRSFVMGLLCAWLAAPLRAGETAWLTSADRRHIIQVPAGWTAAAAVPGLTPRGLPHAFSLAPASRAFVLDIGAEYTLPPKSISTEDYFAKALKLAGNPRPKRAELADHSLFEYFSSTAAVRGRASYRVQGVLYKYVQRYYLTFSSAEGSPGDKDWQAALKLLATLDSVDPAAGGWEKDYITKLSGESGLGEAAGNKLRYLAAARPDGTWVSFDDIAIFGCQNFVGNLYVFNEARTAHCWIASMKDYRAILGKLDTFYWKDAHPLFQDCPGGMRLERACDPERPRDF